MTAVRGALAIAIATVAVTVVAMVLSELAPGTAGERAARSAGVLPADDSAIPGPLRQDIVDRVERAHGLDAPLVTRIGRQLGGYLRGDLGRSWHTGEPIRARLVRAGLRTAALVIGALVLAIALGIGGAAIGRLSRGRLRSAPALISSALVVIPPVWIALVLLRASGGGGAGLWAVISLAALPAALISRHADAALREFLSAPHAMTARARGVSEWRLVVVHGSREVAAALAALLPGLVGYSIGAAMVIETVFGIRGLGAALATASASQDAPVIVAIVTACGFAVATAAVAARAIRRLADPRLESA